jgi:hypothetical protein
MIWSRNSRHECGAVGGEAHGAAVGGKIRRPPTPRARSREANFDRTSYSLRRPAPPARALERAELEGPGQARARYLAGVGQAPAKP